MGRLDDIIARNQKAAGRGSSFDPLGVSKPSEPGEAPQPFSLPSQEKRSAPIWKVLILMALIGVVVGVKVCRMQSIEDEDRRDRQQQSQP